MFNYQVQLQYVYYVSFVIIILLSPTFVQAQEQAIDDEPYNEDVNEDAIWDDIDSLDFIDEEDVDSLNDDDTIEISSLIVIIDGYIYDNPDFYTTSPKGTTSIKMLMRTLTFRQNERMTFAVLKKQMYFSLQNIDASSFFYADLNSIEYVDLGTITDDGHNKIKVYVSVKQGNGFAFSGGNAYGMFGLRYPFGLYLEMYAGVNRAEINVRYYMRGVRAADNTFSSVFPDIGGKILWYWLWPALGAVDANMMIYGGTFDVGLKVHPALRFYTGVGAYAMSTIKEGSTDATRIRLGIPKALTTDYTIDSRSEVQYAQRYGSTMMFENYLEIQVPFIAGFWKKQTNNNMTYYDLSGTILEAQIATKWSTFHHAIHVKVGFISNVISTEQPLIGKANIRGRFFDESGLAVELYRRGSYPTDVTIGNKAFATNLEYRIGGLPTGIVSYEFFAFYDVGAAADEFEDLRKNIRHAIGPGFALHFATPVGLMARFSAAFGGPLLGQPDGSAFAFRISVVPRR